VLVLTLRAGPAELAVATDRGGRIDRLTVDGLDLLLTEADAPGTDHYGAFVMAPWAGRVRDGIFTVDGQTYELPRNAPPHAIHGTVRDRPWVIEESSPSEARLSCLLGRVWPWGGWCEHRLTLTEDRLSLRLSLHAERTPFPASLGLHPWFRRHMTAVGASDARLELPAQSMYQRDAAGIPTGVLVPPPEGPWDDCFTGLTGPPVLRWGRDQGFELSLGTDARCIVVYDQPEAAVCVEPQTGPPDALNIDPAWVTPDSPLRLAVDLSWRRLDQGS
jgi:galactose mutarotase-like enzyme